MGESLIVRKGGSGSRYKVIKNLKTEIITFTQNWVVPKAVNQSFTVRIFGAGGGGKYGILVMNYIKCQF